ncbi:MAG: hypothetical protein ABID09_03445 [Candidatus Omnitrophota bacterium]
MRSRTWRYLLCLAAGELNVYYDYRGRNWAGIHKQVRMRVMRAAIKNGWRDEDVR